jgi:hypothetical protein
VAVLWTGQPNADVIFHLRDLYLIPFISHWGGFAIFWEWGVLGYRRSPQKTDTDSIRWFMTRWGIPFVFVGQYLIGGRFIFE